MGPMEWRVWNPISTALKRLWRPRYRAGQTRRPRKDMYVSGPAFYVYDKDLGRRSAADARADARDAGCRCLMNNRAIVACHGHTPPEVLSCRASSNG